MALICIPTDKVVEIEYENGKKGEPLYQQIDSQGIPISNFYTKREVKSLNGEIITEKEIIKKGLQYALMLLKSQASAGLYPKAALLQYGGDGFLPIIKAINIIKLL